MPEYSPSKEPTSEPFNPKEFPRFNVSPITDCRIIGNCCYVMSGTMILFVVEADKVIDWTKNSVKVRYRQSEVQYNHLGEIVSSVRVWE